MSAQDRWARQPAEWAIPAHVLAGTAESPWVLPRTVFRRRAQAQLAAPTAAATRAVVLESAARHPLIDLNPLWRHFHGIDRPEGPTAEGLLAALGELGVRPEVHRWRRPPEPEHRELRRPGRDHPPPPVPAPGGRRGGGPGAARARPPPRTAPGPRLLRPGTAHPGLAGTGLRALTT